MEENKDRLVIPDMPDEAEYPAELTERYELLECFSETEEMRTLLALDRKSGERCVVKCYLRENALYEHSEPDALRKLDAPPMPRFLGEYRNECMRCVLREYVPGNTLSVTAEHKKFSEEDAIDIGLQLCDQLDVLHTRKPPIIHRDIKPQNVVARPDGTVVLIDFGIARIHTNNETGTIAFGTQGFAPPEQYGFSQTDARSDIYSLGILLHWLVHRETKIADTDHRPLDKAVARCTSFDPERRFSDVRQVKRALLAAKPGAQRKRRLLTFAAALLLALAATGMSFVVRSVKNAVGFTDPLIEQAVRLDLSLDDTTVITEEMLAQVTGIYIVADAAYPDPDSFYPAISQWYADGKSTRGSVTDLSDLARMSNVEQICIAAQELTDISALTGLKRKISKTY